MDSQYGQFRECGLAVSGFYHRLLQRTTLRPETRDSIHRILERRKAQLMPEPQESKHKPVDDEVWNE